MKKFCPYKIPRLSTLWAGGMFVLRIQQALSATDNYSQVYPVCPVTQEGAEKPVAIPVLTRSSIGRHVSRVEIGVQNGPGAGGNRR